MNSLDVKSMDFQILYLLASRVSAGKRKIDKECFLSIETNFIKGGNKTMLNTCFWSLSHFPYVCPHVFSP